MKPNEITDVVSDIHAKAYAAELDAYFTNMPLPPGTPDAGNDEASGKDRPSGGSIPPAAPSLWVPCPGCSEHQRRKCGEAAQCSKKEDWKAPTTEEELDAYAEAMNCSIFYARREIRRLQQALDEMEPVFERLVRMREQ